MFDKLLFSLLFQLNDMLTEDDIEIARKKAPIVIDNLLETDGCAIYTSKADQKDFYLDKEYSFFKEYNFLDSWQKYDLPLACDIDFINIPDLEVEGYGGGFQRVLKIPLHFDKKILGIVMIAKKDACQLDNLSRREQQLLELLSRFLSDIYCTYPLVHELKKREKDLAILYQKAEQELEDSRKQVSLELHDEVGQVLTSILLQIKLLQQSEDLDYIRGRLGGLHHITRETLEEVRRISQNLRPYLLEKLGLQAAIEAHIKNYVENTRIEVELRTHNVNKRIAEDLETIVFRGVQEGLTNVARHSGASKATITLTIKNNNLFLQIMDNGHGMKSNALYRTGLLGMRERATRVKGKFWLVNREGEGLSVNILLPLGGTGEIS